MGRGIWSVLLREESSRVSANPPLVAGARCRAVDSVDWAAHRSLCPGWLGLAQSQRRGYRCGLLGHRGRAARPCLRGMACPFDWYRGPGSRSAGAMVAVRSSWSSDWLSGRRVRAGNPEGGPAMIMRITWGKLRPGSWNEFEKTYKATVATKGGTSKGLRGRWLLQDTADADTGFAVSLWKTRQRCRPTRRAISTRRSSRPPSSRSSSASTRPIAVRSSTCNSSR